MIMNEEYRDKHKIISLIKAINKKATRRWKIMEVCGGQTNTILKSGIEELLLDSVEFIHGPGCPVCITPEQKIDEVISLSTISENIILTFGDMMRVPGSMMTLNEAKSEGADIRVVYSPIDSIRIAKENPDKKIIFFGIGFETTMPLYATLLLCAEKLSLRNLFILHSLYSVTGILNSLFNDEMINPDAVLAAGHVCAVTGYDDYFQISACYNKPFVIAGFEVFDILCAVYSSIEMLESGICDVKNEYTRTVGKKQNSVVKSIFETVYEPANQQLRGFGMLSNGGYRLKERFEPYDAASCLRSELNKSDKIKRSDNYCMDSVIMCGKAAPTQCQYFANSCTPMTPKGASMVTSEGICAAYYKNCLNHTIKK